MLWLHSGILYSLMATIWVNAKSTSHPDRGWVLENRCLKQCCIFAAACFLFLAIYWSTHWNQFHRTTAQSQKESNIERSEWIFYFGQKRTNKKETYSPALDRQNRSRTFCELVLVDWLKFDDDIPRILSFSFWVHLLAGQLHNFWRIASIHWN